LAIKYREASLVIIEAEWKAFFELLIRNTTPRLIFIFLTTLLETGFGFNFSKSKYSFIQKKFNTFVSCDVLNLIHHSFKYEHRNYAQKLSMCLRCRDTMFWKKIWPVNHKTRTFSYAIVKLPDKKWWGRLEHEILKRYLWS